MINLTLFYILLVCFILSVFVSVSFPVTNLTSVITETLGKMFAASNTYVHPHVDSLTFLHEPVMHSKWKPCIYNISEQF